MELILIRHARPEVIEHDPNGADPALTELGHRQASAMADFLADEHIDAIWASTMRRARETVAPLAATKDLDVRFDDRLVEMDAGSTSYGVGDPMRDGDEAVAEMVATVRDPAFVGRVASALEDIIDSHRGQRVAVVCHGGVIAVGIGALLGLDDFVIKVAPSYTSVSRLAASSNGYRSLQSFNEAHWLRETG